MKFDEVKEYIDKVIKSEKFQKLAEFTHMLDIDPHEDIYENIKIYLEKFTKVQLNNNEWVITNNGSREYSCAPNYDEFIKFLDHYLNNNPSETVLNSKGWIDLDKTLYLDRPKMFLLGRGFFLNSEIIFTDGSIYFTKTPVYVKRHALINNSNCVFCPLIASYVARALQVEVPEINLAIGVNGPQILSKNFLKPNEELIQYSTEGDDDTILAQFNELDFYLRSRRCSKEEIETARFEFIKQEFVAKMIGLKDQHPENSPVIAGIDENGNRHIRVAPMFDLDFCFHIAEQTNLLIRKCDNGKNDVASLIKQYRDYPGFMQYVKKSIEQLDMSKIFKEIYEETGITRFRDCENDEEIMKFADFVNNNIQIAKKTIEKETNNEREEK